MVPTVQGLTQPHLDPVVDQAISYWTAAGTHSDRLSNVDIRIADIPGSRLGVTSSSGIIWIDRDAAGYGWSIDGAAATNGQGGIDLLSVVSHELGHVLGFNHDQVDEVMAASLAPGVRRIPRFSDP